MVKENVYRLYPNLGYWFMLFIPLVIAGFFFTYFSQLDLPQPTIIHFHFALMSLWLALIITQPLLIRYKKTQLHRTIGRMSYVIIPLVILSTFQMLRYSYAYQWQQLEESLAAGTATTTLEQGRITIANFLSIAFVYLFWLMVFYTLAIWNRKNPSLHARFMIAAAMTFIGPTIDRILIFSFEIYQLGPGIPVEVLGFSLINLLLLYLLVRDIRSGKSPVPYGSSLAIYLIFQLFHLKLTSNALWESFVRTLLQ